MAYSSKRTQNYNQQKRTQSNTSGYVGAPYNFVALNQQVISYGKEQIPAQNSFRAAGERQDEELYSGEIGYTIEAQNDIFVGGPNGREFYRSISGSYAIPGSSIRGLMRGNMQILGMGSIDDDVDDYKLMYRKVGAKSDSTLGKEYKTILGVRPLKAGDKNSISICANVQAGYLKFDGRKYHLIEIPGGPLQKGSGNKQNYYTLRESTIIGEYRRSEKNRTKNPYAYLIEIAKKHLMYRHDMKSYPFIQGEKGKAIPGSRNLYYRPSVYEISFKVSSNNQVEKVGKPGELTGPGCQEGLILSSGFMDRKKTHYIIPAIDVDDPNLQSHELPDEAIETYQHDFQAKEKLLGTTLKLPSDEKEKERILAETRDFYRLPQKKGECRPIFFIETNTDSGKSFHFGFTPYQRLFFRHTIKDGIPESHKTAAPDYASAMLGYSRQQKNGKNEARKGRVFFEDAELIPSDQGAGENAGKLKEAVQPILASPKPTSCPDYLTQDQKNGITYNSSHFTIRGYKQYWLHEQACASQTTTKEQQAAAFRPLGAGSRFHGTIRFKNLYADELGLLLWSLRLEKGSLQNIGKARAYGYGKIRITIDSLKLLDLKKMYDSLTLDFEPYRTKLTAASPELDSEVENWIQKYKQTANRLLGSGKDIMKEPSIRQFLLMKDGTRLPDETKIRYMSVDAKEYQKRTKGLPFPEEVLGEKVYQRQAAASPGAAASASSVSSTSSISSGETAFDEKRVTTDADVKDGAVVKGTINNIAKKAGVPYGVFVTLTAKYKGLLHKNNMAHSIDYYKVGEDIVVRVSMKEQGKLNLSDKDL